MEIDAVVMIMVSMVHERVGEDNSAAHGRAGEIPTGEGGRPLAALSDPARTEAATGTVGACAIRTPS